MGENQLDQIGTYLGYITEGAVSETKNGFPQLVARFQATQKFVGDAAGMAHFGITEPGYVDWTEFDESIVGYLVLFNSTEQFDNSTKLLSYDNLVRALKWDGIDFSDLDNPDFYKEKLVLFRVEENTFNGKVSLKVSWVDDPEANPERQLRKLDADKLKGLSAKLKMGMGGGRSAKPVSAPNPTRSPVSAAPVASKPTSATVPTLEAKTADTISSPPAGSRRRGRPSKASQTPVAEPSGGMSKDEAWDFVLRVAGDKATEAPKFWIKACEKIGGKREESTFTAEEWAAIANETAASFK